MSFDTRVCVLATRPVLIALILLLALAFAGCGADSSDGTGIVVADIDRTQAASSYSAYAINSTDQSLWAWGYNTYGNLGDGSTTPSSTPVLIASGETWEQIAAGDNHAVGLKSDGTVWAWGRNNKGQLGDGTLTQRTSPVQVCAEYGVGTCTIYFTGAVSIAAGATYTGIVKSDGTVWSIGGSSVGPMLGDGSTDDTTDKVQYVPVQVCETFTTPGTCDSAIQDVVTLSAGYSHVLALKSDGTLWGWGDNGSYQLGLGVDDWTDRSVAVQLGADSQWLAISTEFDKSFAIKSDGTLWFWGYGWSYDSGQGQEYSYAETPEQVGTSADWAHIATGYSHTLGIQSDGSLWGWGYNDYGQLGDTADYTTTAPAQVGGDTDWAWVAPINPSTLAKKSDGSLWVWGGNDYGLLAQGYTPDAETTIVQLNADSDWAKVVSGEYHSLALKSTGTLWSWGANYYGQLGNGTTVPQDVPVQITVSGTITDVAAGLNLSMVLLDDGTVWAWGQDNDGANWGMLGQDCDSTTCQDSNVPVQVKDPSDLSGFLTGVTKLDVGSNGAIVLKSDGTVWAWGASTLPDETNSVFAHSSIPVQEPTLSTSWSDVAVGSLGLYAVDSTGNAFAWGKLNNGAAGMGVGSVVIYSPAAVCMTSASPPACDTPLDGVAQIDAGMNYAMVIRNDGSAYSWGSNNSGDNLGHSSASSFVMLPGQIGSATDWVALVAEDFGFTHSLGLGGSPNASLYAWGEGATYALCQGSTSDRATPTIIESGKYWLDIAAGWGTTIALRDDNTLWGCGKVFRGTLGTDTALASVPVSITLQ